MKESGETNTLLHAAAEILFSEATALGVIITQLEGALHHVGHVHFFVDHLADREGFALPDEVTPPEFIWRQSHRLGNVVEVPFERKDALGRTKSPESAVWRRIRCHGGTADADVGAGVRSGGVNGSAGEHDRRKCQIGASVKDEFDIHGEKLAIARDCGAVARPGGMPLRRRDHILTAVVDNFYGPAGLP